MTHALATGHTSHTRFSPIKRTFCYRLNYLLIDLDTAETLDHCWGFKWNRRCFFSLHHQTYLTPGTAPLHQKARAFMAEHLPNTPFDRICLLTTPRFFNINFNPVSFFYFLDTNNNIVSIIAEVHNTYAQKHLYLLHEPVLNGTSLEFNHQKTFHVSPFYTTDGTYQFVFSRNLCNINVTINYVKGCQKMFNATLNLKTSQIKPSPFLRMGIQFIWTAITTFPRILIQASILKFKHKLPHYKNNGLQSPLSFSKKPPSLVQKLCEKIVHNYLSKITVGHLTLLLPNSDTRTYGDPKATLRATIDVSNYSFFYQLMIKGDMGLADAFIRGAWTTPNLTDVFMVFIKNESVGQSQPPITRLHTILNRIQHYHRNNSVNSAKKNIYAHYDLGNSFFDLFLDKHKVYSSAVFESKKQSLEDAQINKISQMLSLADVQPHHRILEIGSGWGALAIHAATTIGCHVTTVTISEEQYNFVKKQINQRHLDNKIEVKLMDYRHLTGQYDRIVSVEMLEAVGHQYLDTFFRQCHHLLTHTGKAAFQCIMIPKERYKNYMKKPDFIQKYIFPGGHLPYLELIQNVTLTAGFKWGSDAPITAHYVPTLHAWDVAFRQKESDIKALGFDESFIRTWHYYFHYCAAGFQCDYIQNHHFLIEK
jgi:cyclopropane-fatty-acyl-phospholipid synthase